MASAVARSCVKVMSGASARPLRTVMAPSVDLDDVGDLVPVGTVGDDLLDHEVQIRADARARRRLELVDH